MALESDEGVLEDYAQHIQEFEFVLVETGCSPRVLSQKDRDLNVGPNNIYLCTRPWISISLCSLICEVQVINTSLIVCCEQSDNDMQHTSDPLSPCWERKEKQKKSRCVRGYGALVVLAAVGMVAYDS